METLERISSQFTSSPSTSPSPKNLTLSNPPFTNSPTPPSSVTRLWRPAAQRNLRNQWSNLAASRKKWASVSSSGRSHATSLVNSYLSQKYMHAMELGVLKNMTDIKERASWKLFKQQELHQRKLISSYKDLVSVVNNMVITSRSMRCYQKGPNSSPLIQFVSCSEDKNDLGDGGGIPVFGFWSVSYVETLARELVQIFTMELCLKRLLAMELLSISCEVPPVSKKLCWSNELYHGEFDDLSICNLYCVETSEPPMPTVNGRKADNIVLQTNNQPDQEILQFYLTTWFTEVNIDTQRVDEIFSTIGEEMHVVIS